MPGKEYYSPFQTGGLAVCPVSLSKQQLKNHGFIPYNDFVFGKLELSRGECTMRRMVVAILLASLLAVSLTGPVWAQKQINFWTTEVEKDRLTVQKNLAQSFAKKSGIKVKVVPVRENRLAQRVTAAYAARSLPDVIYHPIAFTIGWAEAGILDPIAATEVVKALGQATFAAGPLNLVKTGQGFAAVPVDGWGQLLLYRKDLFKEKGLARPDTWKNILAAAQALHNPPLLWGFEAASDPGQTYTQQVFEHFALSNGARLVDGSGAIKLNTPRMIQTLEFYKKLSGYSPPGNLYWLHTRLDYLAGRAAMVIWSPFILDELSGLRQDQPVVPDAAKGKPGFLAKNTGFVTIIKGPHGAAQYGQTGYLGISKDADTKAAQKWVQYLLSDGYLKWLAMAAEGKLPVRRGTSGSPELYVQGWQRLEFGVTTRARISEFYGPQVVKEIVSGVEGFDRWGFTRGKGALVTKIYGTKVIPQVLKRFLDGELDAKKAATEMQKRVKALK
jgi:multiple sugar transport system substrate-binding protein